MEYQILQGNHAYRCQTIDDLAGLGWRLLGPVVPTIVHDEEGFIWYVATMYKETI